MIGRVVGHAWRPRDRPYCVVVGVTKVGALVAGTTGRCAPRASGRGCAVVDDHVIALEERKWHVAEVDIFAQRVARVVVFTDELARLVEHEARHGGAATRRRHALLRALAVAVYVVVRRLAAGARMDHASVTVVSETACAIRGYVAVGI